jgi:hypothetical protein
MMSPSSLARSSGMVATATSPALTTASQASAMPIGVAAAQQHAVAGHQAQVLRQHLGDAVHALAGLRVGERDAGRAQQRPVAKALGIAALSSSSSTSVELRRQLQFRQVIAQLRPLFAAAGGREQNGLSAPTCFTPVRTDLPMISCCTSVAPS